MWILKLESNPNGSHDDHQSDHITAPPAGWAVIPEGFSLPESFPFVGVEAAEMDGVMTVTAMTAGVLPEEEPVEEKPTALDQLEAQVIYTAMMTDTLLEG